MANSAMSRDSEGEVIMVVDGRCQDARRLVVVWIGLDFDGVICS